MNPPKKLEYARTKQRIEHHVTTLEQKLVLGTARCDLEPHVECLCLLLERLRGLSGETQETGAFARRIADLSATVEGRPHLHLVR